MEKFDVHILGCGSAKPTPRHYPTSQVVNFREKLFMIDCGEGAQMQFSKLHLNVSRLHSIFISHLHGDHCFGLIGLISTLNLLGRTAGLHIYCPMGLENLMQPWMDFFVHQMTFSVLFHEFDAKVSAQIYEDRSLTVTTIPLTHRIPCCGFLFSEKPSPNHLIREMLDAYEIPLSERNRIKNGADYLLADGRVIPNAVLTTPAAPPRRYAYCSDTMYQPSVVEQIAGANLLFHEATFMEEDAVRAKETFHSTARQAALIAKEAGVGQLLIGHYSARYHKEDSLLAEARAVFSNTVAAHENLCISVK